MDGLLECITKMIVCLWVAWMVDWHVNNIDSRGAAGIAVRYCHGRPCWRDLTCQFYDTVCTVIDYPGRVRKKDKKTKETPSKSN